MTIYQSKTGETGDRAYWERELDSFWSLFKGRKETCNDLAKLPDRPQDAWERFAKVLRLVEVESNADRA